MLRFVHPLLWYTLTFSPERLLRSRFVAAFFPSADSEAERTIEKKLTRKSRERQTVRRENFRTFSVVLNPKIKKNAVKRSTNKNSKLRTAWRNEHQTGRLRLCADLSTRSFANKNKEQVRTNFLHTQHIE